MCMPMCVRPVSPHAMSGSDLLRPACTCVYVRRAQACMHKRKIGRSVGASSSSFRRGALSEYNIKYTQNRSALGGCVSGIDY